MRAMSWIVSLSLALSVAAAAIWVVWVTRDAQGSLLRPDDGGVVRLGQRLYAEHCAACHGRDLEGQPEWRRRDADGYLPGPPHDATGHTWHHADALLFKMTKHGMKSIAGPDYKTRMPAYEGVLSDEEIVAVLSFIKSRWPKRIQDRHDRINAAAGSRQGGLR